MVYQWLLAAMPLAVPALAGVAMISRIKALREQTGILAVGTVLGITAYGTIAYAIAHIVPLMPQIVAAELLCFAGIAGYMFWNNGWHNFMAARKDKIAYGILAISLILFSVIGSKLLIESKEGLYTGIINAYGDIGWHSALIMQMAEQNALPIQNPIFAGETLTYPLLADLISASMIALGSSLSASVNVPAMLLIPCLLLLVYLFVSQYSENRTAGMIGFILFLFGGATLGWLQFVSDAAAIDMPLRELLLHLPDQDYSGVGTSTQGFHFLNPVTSLLLPQRAMLFGMPIVLSVLLLIHPKILKNKGAAISGGLLAGMLPLFHAHACIALASAIVGIYILSRAKKLWGAFFLPAFAIGIPELFFYAQGEAVQESFFRYGPFWMAGERNKIYYWLQNTGLYIPLTIIGLWSNAPKPAKTVACSGIFLFLIANTFLFAPWEWDNFKLFVFWFIFILPLISYLASYAWKRYSSHALRTGIIILILIHTFAAMLDIYKLALPTAQSWIEWDTDAIDIARMIQKVVPRNAVILTAGVHNSPVVLSGRKIFLGYPAHIWSHGKSPWKREAQVKQFFAGSIDMIENQRPRYIFIGPQEEFHFTPLVIQPSWQVAASAGPYTLFSAY